MNITIRTVPHDTQRYNTVGDYFLENGALIITISDTGNPDYNFALALHELWELHRAQRAGISLKAIDDFDMIYTGDGEVGNDPKAPYHIQHLEATALEKWAIKKMGYKWSIYDKAIDTLSDTHPTAQPAPRPDEPPHV